MTHPSRDAIAAKLREWADTGESFEMKARWLHEWLLSGAATPAPTAALTEEEIHDLIKEHLGAIENTIVGKSEFFAGLMGLLREKGVVKG